MTTRTGFKQALCLQSSAGISSRLAPENPRFHEHLWSASINVIRSQNVFAFIWPSGHAFRAPSSAFFLSLPNG